MIDVFEACLSPEIALRKEGQTGQAPKVHSFVGSLRAAKEGDEANRDNPLDEAHWSAIGIRRRSASSANSS